MIEKPRTSSSRRSRQAHIAVLVLALLALFACAAPASETQDKNWTSVAELVETSDRIIVARLVDSREEVVELSDPPETRLVRFGQFEVLETLKGTTDRGDTIWIAFDREELVDGEGRPATFSNEQATVMFLKGRLRPLEYPSDIGAVLWTGNGDPAFAKLVGDDLVFMADPAYLTLLLSEDQALPNPESVSPFAATLEEMRQLAE